MREYLKGATRIMEDGEEVMGSSVVKKRKLYSELGNAYCGEVERKEGTSVLSSSASQTYDCCSKRDESSDIVRNSLRSPDLENVGLQFKGYEAEISTPVNDIFSREATPTSELWGDSEQVSSMDSSHNSKKISSPALVEESEKKPSAEEVEEFFSAAEKNLQKGFAEKYNYDIGKDIPLEGRYQWVRLKH